MIWIARIARPDAIFDSSAAAQTFSVCKMIDILEETKTFPNMKKKKIRRKKTRMIAIPRRGVQSFYMGNKMVLTKWIF